jgi:hypothetical protein
MKEFLLLFRGGEPGMDPTRESPERYQLHMLKWKNWMEDLGKQGKFGGGHPLTKTGTVIQGGKKVVTDGPFVEGKEIVSGYIVIKAKDFREAVEIGKDCPIFDYDGIVEVREVQAAQV